ncbi:COMM domain-containing protein 2 [Arctopsyche grandis]|uniref:COMM domain-containing protein 2 n=1 Tax=Arctopsyche grandis TaxID=121162 RepID=UPI00406D66B9
MDPAEAGQSNDEEQDEEEEPQDVLKFDGDLIKHVNMLLEAPEQVFKDFCRLALDYLHNGPNEKRYNIAADKLNTPLVNISNAVHGLVYILINACKYNLKEEEFSTTLNEIGFSDENVKVLVKFLVAKRDNLKRAMSRFGVDQPLFHNLEWRAEAQVSSRSLPDHVIPSVTLDFALSNYEPVQKKMKLDDDESSEDDGAKKVITHRVLQCDIPNLVNMIGCLETALRETKYYHAKKTKTAMAKK